MLRRATDADVDVIRQWRNQQPNRAVSLHSHEITPAEHAAWWSAASTDPTRLVLVYEHAGTSAGVVNFFDLDLDLAGRPYRGSWGFFLDAEGLAERGETLPAWIGIMRAATGYAFDELGLEELHGEVLEHNSVVRHMNRRFRFVEGIPECRKIDGRPVTVIPISLHRASRRQPQGNAPRQPTDQPPPVAPYEDSVTGSVPARGELRQGGKSQ